MTKQVDVQARMTHGGGNPDDDPGPVEGITHSSPCFPRGTGGDTVKMMVCGCYTCVDKRLKVKNDNRAG